MNANGSVFKYPDNVDTDVIIPARYLNTPNAQELATHCMEDIDKEFIHNVKDGDIMVGGWNFGCGSSREHAPLAIKTAGISVVIAKSFARIFYRNAINIGLPILVIPEADKIKEGDTMGMTNGKLEFVGDTPVRSVYKVAKALMNKHTSFITLIYGEGITEEEANEALRLIKNKAGDGVDINLVNGGQPVYYFILSVE